ncbi:hypothetical protein [uncultured Algoriphagus sp.]|uniref:hypothetical protein n=1 Tax=uncultured Algoriphagus sp. TaxID=417365 RepID=UPI0030ECE78C|tara:strand:+ start:6763 stop:7182 length:420 start_codon:yes stop_codon:yes gene_type:complete
MKALEEIPFKPEKGHLVKFHTPYPEEDPSQLYLLLEVKDYDHFDTPWADILALGTGFSFPSINMVKLEDLEVVEWNTEELLGNYGAVLKEDGSKVPGKIIQISTDGNNKEPLGNLTIHALIRDDKGEEHNGRLLMDSLR